MATAVSTPQVVSVRASRWTYLLAYLALVTLAEVFIAIPGPASPGGPAPVRGRDDRDPAGPARVRHPAAGAVDPTRFRRLAPRRRGRHLPRDRPIRGAHLPRHPLEAGRRSPRGPVRPPLRDRDFRQPAHLLPQRLRPRLRLRRRPLLRLRRPEDEEPLGRHLEPQPRERHPVPGRTVPLTRSDPKTRPGGRGARGLR